MNIELYQRILVNLNDLFRLKPTIQLAEDIQAIEEQIAYIERLDKIRDGLFETVDRLNARIDEDLQQRHNNLFKENGEFRSLSFGEIMDNFKNRPIFEFNHDPNKLIELKLNKDRNELE